MADDGKKTENICAKVTERMALDMLHLAAGEGLSVSAYLYRLVRAHLYGEMVRVQRSNGNLQDERNGDDR